MDAYDTYQYIFHDTISAGLTLDMGSFDVYVAKEKNQDPVALKWNEVPAENYTLTPTENGFTLAIDNLKEFPYVTQEGRKYILVFYDAELNGNAEIGLPGNENTAYLEFSNDPNGDGTGRTEDDKVIVFTYQLDGTKVDGETQAALQNAQFVLLNGAKSEAAVVVAGKVTEWIKFGTQADSTKLEIPTTYEGWTALAQQHNGLILTSDENGLFNIAGLDDGTYFLREIQAPNGYNLLKRMCNWILPPPLSTGRNGMATPQPPSKV